MSGATIAPYFPFRRIKIIGHSVIGEAGTAYIQVEPDKRYHPICHGCGHRATGVHSWVRRKVRDLSMATARVWVPIPLNSSTYSDVNRPLVPADSVQPFRGKPSS